MFHSAISQRKTQSSQLLAAAMVHFVVETSASRNRRPENVRILAVIVAELKFRNIQRHIFAADFVERADDAALEDRPEAFDRVGMYGADHDRVLFVVGHAFHILTLGMVDGSVREFAVQVLIANPAIGAEQADLVRNGLANEFGKRVSAHVLNDASHDIALTPHGANDRSFAGTDAASPAALATLI